MAIPLRRSDPANIVAGCRTFFVTSSIAEKRNLLQSHRSAELFIDVLYQYRSQHKYLLHDFVVMPDHFHMLITVGHEISIERAVQFIKGGFAFRAGRELGFTPLVWERVVFQRYGFMARKLSHAFGNISLRIQSKDDWFRGQRNTPILYPNPDSNLTRYRTG